MVLTNNCAAKYDGEELTGIWSLLPPQIMWCNSPGLLHFCQQNWPELNHGCSLLKPPRRGGVNSTRSVSCGSLARGYLMSIRSTCSGNKKRGRIAVLRMTSQVLPLPRRSWPGRDPWVFMVLSSSISFNSNSRMKTPGTSPYLRTTWTFFWPLSWNSQSPQVWSEQLTPTVCWTRWCRDRTT